MNQKPGLSQLRLHLQLPAFVELLGLSREQQQEIENVVKKTEREFLDSVETELAAIKIVYDNLWTDFLDTLSDEDKKTVTRVIGEPVAWYAGLNLPQKLRNRNHLPQSRVTPKVFVGTEVPIQAEKIGRFIADYNDEELEARGFEVVDSFVLRFVESDVVQDYLELSEEQKVALQAAFTEYEKTAVIKDFVTRERLDELEKPGPSSYPKRIAAALSPEDLEKLKWLEYQWRKRSRTVFFAAEKLLRDVDLKDNPLLKRLRNGSLESFTKMYFDDFSLGRRLVDSRIESEFRVRAWRGANSEGSEEMKSFLLKRVKFLDRVDERVRDVLTDEQLHRYQETISSKPKRQAKSTG